MPGFKTLDDSIRPLASRNYSVILRGLGDHTQKRVAELLGCAESTLSEFKDDLERAAQIMAAAGLKVVRQSDKTMHPEEVASLISFARKGLDSMAEASGFGELGS